MREKIIFAPGARESELTRNLALHGINCINLKVMSAGQLARYALMKSGVTITEDFLSANEANALIAEAIASEAYFGKTTYSDIQQVAQTINKMRSLVESSDEAKIIEETLKRGIFKEKNEALFSTYQNYMGLLGNGNYLDSIMLIRKAISEAKSWDADFVCLDEYPLNPLEKALISHLSDNKYATQSLTDLYQATNADIKINSFKNCYGAPNEVETIINDIYANKTLDNCTVAMTDAGTYSQLFLDYALLHDIPITFGCGVPIVNSNPAKLLILYYRWITNGFFGRDAINEMLHSSSFDRKIWKEQFPEYPEGFSWSKFTQVLGGLRLTNNADLNRIRLENYRNAIDEEEKIVRQTDEKAYRNFLCRKLSIPFLEIASRELALPTEDFIAKYSHIRKGSATNAEKLLMKIDQSAVKAIYEELGVIRKSGIEQSTDDLIMNALGIEICGETSESGKLHITDIGGAMSTVRENLYIVGLSASKYPGSPTENYLLLDSDIKLFGDKALFMTSDGKIRRKRENLVNLVKLATNLGSKIDISFAGLNVSELKKDNASSMLFELFKLENGSNATTKALGESIIKIDYFQPAISSTREIGKAYNAGKNILFNGVGFDLDLDVTVDLDREWSPSAINMFFEDPEGFKMVHLLGITEAEPTDPFEIISAIEFGNIAHSLMERLANSDMTKNEFAGISEEYFNRYIAENPPLIDANVDHSRAEFVEMMETAYDNDLHREVVLKEEEIHSEHPSGVKIYGLPDRVEKLEDGSYIVVDFKTGRKVSQETNNVSSCLQVIIYAYMLEQLGYKISGGEYRYLRTGEVITCKYDDEVKAKLNTILTSFKNGVEGFGFDTEIISDEAEEVE